MTVELTIEQKQNVEAVIGNIGDGLGYCWIEGWEKTEVEGWVHKELGEGEQVVCNGVVVIDPLTMAYPSGMKYKMSNSLIRSARLALPMRFVKIAEVMSAAKLGHETHNKELYHSTFSQEYILSPATLTRGSKSHVTIGYECVAIDEAGNVQKSNVRYSTIESFKKMADYLGVWNFKTEHVERLPYNGYNTNLSATTEPPQGQARFEHLRNPDRWALVYVNASQQVKECMIDLVGRKPNFLRQTGDGPFTDMNEEQSALWSLMSMFRSVAEENIVLAVAQFKNSDFREYHQGVIL